MIYTVRRWNWNTDKQKQAKIKREPPYSHAIDTIWYSFFSSILLLILLLHLLVSFFQVVYFAVKLVRLGQASFFSSQWLKLNWYWYTHQPTNHDRNNSKQSHTFTRQKNMWYWIYIEMYIEIWRKGHYTSYQSKINKIERLYRSLIGRREGRKGKARQKNNTKNNRNM